MTLNAYQLLNKSFKKELIYKVGMSAGFFSEYNCMILSMLYCLEHKIQFKLCSGATNFHPEGWNGFFLPFCEQVEDNSKHYKTSNWRYALKLIIRDGRFSNYRSLIPYLSWTKKKLKTQDVFGRSRSSHRAKKNYQILGLGINGNIQEACSKLIEITWRYNEKTQKGIDGLKASVNISGDYIGFHIRGGDKFIEHKIEPVEAYFDKVNDPNIRTAFVLTDDYSVIENIHRLYPGWDIKTLCREEERGYFFENFLSQPEELQGRQYLRLFASIDILSQSQQFIGTYSSNPGMYLGMRNAKICTGVDYDTWVLR